MIIEIPVNKDYETALLVVEISCALVV